MKKTLIAATALIMLGAPMTFAAEGVDVLHPHAKAVEQHHTIAASTPSARCTALEQQFSKAEPSHKSMTAFKEAAKLRDEGRNLCTANKAPDGVKKLEQALKMIGITPAASS